MQLDQYFTTDTLAERIVKWADIPPGSKVLEPSAGSGNFVKALFKLVPGVKVTAVEIDTVYSNILQRTRLPEERSRFTNLCADFMTFKQRPGNDNYLFDFCIMNPPYGSRKDGTVGLAHDHVRKAFEFSKVVIILCANAFEYGVGGQGKIFDHNVVTKRVQLVRRPVFEGPADKGETARRDHVVLRLEPRQIAATVLDRSEAYLVQEERWLL